MSLGHVGAATGGGQISMANSVGVLGELDGQGVKTNNSTGVMGSSSAANNIGDGMVAATSNNK